LKSVEPVRLMVVFRRKSTRVEKDEDDDEPVERLRLDYSSTELATSTVDAMKPTTVCRQNSMYRVVQKKPRIICHCESNGATTCILLLFYLLFSGLFGDQLSQNVLDRSS